MIAGLAVLTGFLLDIVIAASYGAGPITDSFFVAARLPLGIGALAVAAANQALVPAFAASLNKRSEQATWRLASILITCTLIAGGLLVAAAYLLARPLVALTAPGLPAHEAQLAAELIPVTFALVPLVTSSEVLRALLNSRFSFVVPAATNIALSGTAAAVILLGRHDAHVIAWAYLAGGTVQLAFIAAFAIRNGFRFRPSLRLRDEHFQSVARLSVRPLVSGALNPVTRVAEQIFLSFMPAGSITIVAYGYRLISAVGGTIFFRSVMVTLLPRLSAVESKPEELNRLTRQGVRIMLALSVPLTAFIAALAIPGALVVFQRGRFSRENALLLGAVIAVYAFSLVGSGIQRALLAPFFALLDTRTPLRNTIYGVVANLVLLPAAVGAMMLANAPPVIGVALAYSLAQYVNVAHAAYRIRAVAGSPWRGIAPDALKLALASVLSAVAMVATEAWLGLDRPRPRLEELALLVAVGLIGLVVLGVVYGSLTTGRAGLIGRLRRIIASTTQPGPIPAEDATRPALPPEPQTNSTQTTPGGGNLMSVLGQRGLAPSRLGMALFGIGIAVVLAVSIEAAYTLATGGPKLMLVIPIGVLIGLAMVIIGLINFQLFVFITIAIRASLDVARPDLGNNGSAGIGTASASGLDPAGALAVMFMLASLFWFMARRMGKATSPPPSVHRLALIGFATTGYLSVIASAKPLVSLLEAVRVSAVAVMLTVMEILLVDRAAIKRLLLAIYISGILPVGLTLFFLVLHKPQFTSGGFDRYQGTFSQPNPFAIYLTMLIVMGAALLPHLTPRVRILMVLFMAASIVCLYHTYTRSAWVATVIGIVAVAVIGRRKVLGATLVACLVVGLIAVPTISQRFADLASVAGGTSVNAQGNTSNSLVWRFSYWSQVLPLANDNPITGIGLKMSSFMTDQAKEPHNDFLRAYVETGVVGALAYFALLISMIMVARQGLRESGPGFDRSIAVGFAGCVIAFVLISIVSNVITEVIVLWYYVAFAAAAYAITKFPASEREPEPVVKPSGTARLLPARSSPPA